MYALHLEASASTALAMPPPLRVRFTDTQGLASAEREQREQARCSEMQRDVGRCREM